MAHFKTLNQGAYLRQTNAPVYGIFCRQRRKTAANRYGRRKLRQIALMTAAVAILASGPAAAAWETYTNTTYGYSVEMPGKPTEGTGVYHSDLAPTAATHYVKLTDGNTTFIAMEIDTGRNDVGGLLLGEYEYWLGHIGQITLSNVSRLNIGMEYGRFIDIDCRDDFIPDDPNEGMRARQMFKDVAGITCTNGARITANLFFNQGRLYVATAIQTGDDAKLSGTPGRFANSFDWIGANAERAKTLVDWDAVNAVKGRPPKPQTPAAGGGGRGGR